ncbi:membrane hypothetical protein [Treponema phagedenis]|uniref:Uncharacterized protein n=1 Tax=Treponema phagedenis TaxID=162 RepID=A0A0B7GVM2_TREPH|nr:hypothetical protein C5O78_02875 [Treponema phagedenis]CEM60990.1 membrane hypothetical protein [Treponema phagedenis]
MKKVHALTERGRKGLIKSSIGTFFKNVANVLPVMLVFYFLQQVLVNNTWHAAYVYIIALAIIGVIMYIIINTAYVSQYTETYRESKNLRVDIANILKDLPLSYFSRYDIADLSQTKASNRFSVPIFFCSCDLLYIFCMFMLVKISQQPFPYGRIHVDCFAHARNIRGYTEISRCSFNAKLLPKASFDVLIEYLPKANKDLTSYCKFISVSLQFNLSDG